MKPPCGAARLQGRWLITGASRGIGAAIAREAARRGAKVALLARSAAPIEALAAELSGSAHACDLSQPRSLSEGLTRIEAAGGPIDVLVNNAAADIVGGVLDQSEAELRAAVELNLIAPLLLFRAALGSMAGRGGWIVNVSSMAAAAAFPGMATYAATKAGLSQFTRVARAEAAALGVGTTVVTLGPVETAMLASNHRYDPVRRAFERVRRLRFTRRLEPDEVARLVVDGVARGRAEIDLPARMSPFALLSRLPQRITDWLLRGIAAR